MQQGERNQAVESAWASLGARRYDEALRALSAVQDETDAEMAFLMGLVYAARDFDGRSDELAFKYLEVAAAAGRFRYRGKWSSIGSAFAKFRMGTIHLARNRPNLALPLLEEASREGCADASIALYSVFMRNGDIDRARVYVERAAIEQGHPKARNYLGQLRLRGFYGWRQVIPGLVSWAANVPAFVRWQMDNPS